MIRRIVVWMSCLLFSVAGIPAPALAQSSAPPCRPDAPCLLDPSITSSAMTVRWTSEQSHDFYRLSGALSGGAEDVVQTAGGTRGARTVRPLQRDTTYTFKVMGCDDSSSGTERCTPWSNPLRVLVKSDGAATVLPAECAAALVVPFFTARPNSIVLGDTTTLSWGFVENADRAEIDNDIGGVPTPGSVDLAPDRITTYRLTATGCGGATTRQVTVQVSAFAPNQGFPASTPDSPEAYSPTLEWFNYPLDPDSAARIPGGVAYDIEIQISKQPNRWMAFEKTRGHEGDTYTNIKPFPEGTYQIRFRARARSKDNSLKPGPYADWTIRTFQR